MYNVGWSHGKEKLGDKPDFAKGSFYANPLFDEPGTPVSDWILLYVYIYVRVCECMFARARVCGAVQFVLSAFASAQCMQHPHRGRGASPSRARPVCAHVRTQRA